MVDLLISVTVCILIGYLYFARLIDRKGGFFGKDITKLSQALFSYGWNYLFRNQLNITLAVIVEFRWKGMGTQKGGDDIHRLLFGQPTVDAQCFQLIFDRQTVAALALPGC